MIYRPPFGVVFLLSPQCPASRFPDFDYKCCGKSDVLTKTVFELFEKKYIFAHRHLADDIFAKVFSPAYRKSGQFSTKRLRKHSALCLICSSGAFCAVYSISASVGYFVKLLVRRPERSIN